MKGVSVAPVPFPYFPAIPRLTRACPQFRLSRDLRFLSRSRRATTDVAKAILTSR